MTWPENIGIYAKSVNSLEWEWKDTRARARRRHGHAYLPY